MTGVGFRLEHRISHRISYSPHSPIKNPTLTKEAKELEGRLADILVKGKLSSYEKMLHAEALLLSRWKFKEEWMRYLDSPLIAHADAALSLKNMYDAVVGISEAGIPYAKIFEIMGVPIFDIDYSHHKRGMKTPVMDADQLQTLKAKRAALLTDIDFVTGKTLKEVADYLRANKVNVMGAYIGLSRWPGMKSEDFYIGKNKIDFDMFWKCKTSGLTHLKSKLPYTRGIIPKYLSAYSPNPTVEKNEIMGRAAARRIAGYFKSLENLR